MLLSIPLQSAAHISATTQSPVSAIEATDQHFYGLLNKLTKHNQDRRWLVILDGPKHIDKHLLNQLGIDTKKVLQVQSSANKQKLSCLLTLLSSGSCCAVVTDLNQLEQASLNSLKQASLAGNCQGILLPKSAPAALH